MRAKVARHDSQVPVATEGSLRDRPLDRSVGHRGEAALLRVHQIFKAASLLPPVLLMAAKWDISRQEGWGAWALAASLTPLVVGFSAAMGLVGIALWAGERRDGYQAHSLLIAALLAASPCLWFFARVLYLKLMRSP